MEIRRKEISIASEIVSFATTECTEISQATTVPVEVNFDQSDHFEMKQTRRVRMRSSKSLSSKEYKRLQQNLLVSEKLDFKSTKETKCTEVVERSLNLLETHL